MAHLSVPGIAPSVSSSSEVTYTTFPPRPPDVYLPNPSAPGKATRVSGMIAACKPQKESKILKQSDFPTPPVAEVRPDTFVEFSHQRIDEYYWMKDKTNAKVIEYLNAENAYADTVMASTKGLPTSHLWAKKGSLLLSILCSGKKMR